MISHNVLTFERATRGGGGGRTEVVYWDYMIDGRSLREILRGGDCIPPFGWLRTEADAKFRKMLLLKEASDLRSGRVPLFVCPECADYDCGVLTCIVTKENRSIVWHTFGMERDEVDLLGEHRQHRFSFDRTAYWTSISQLPLSASLA